MDQNINLPIIIKNTEHFSKVEQILYEKNHNMEADYFFLVNGNKINRMKTLEENKIKNNDILTLVMNDS